MEILAVRAVYEKMVQEKSDHTKNSWERKKNSLFIVEIGGKSYEIAMDGQMDGCNGCVEDCFRWIELKFVLFNTLKGGNTKKWNTC